jgi:hypothetical protein
LLHQDTTKSCCCVVVVVVIVIDGIIKFGFKNNDNRWIILFIFILDMDNLMNMVPKVGIMLEI